MVGLSAIITVEPYTCEMWGTPKPPPIIIVSVDTKGFVTLLPSSFIWLLVDNMCSNIETRISSEHNVGYSWV